MRLGILADIHEDVEAVRLALDALRDRVDRIVLLGDLFYVGRRVTEVVDVLAGAGASGVWGNHDLGLCRAPGPHVRARYPGRVLDFTQALRPRLELEGCLFCHGLPQWDPTDPAIYYLGDRPETAEGREEAFRASPCRVTFVGHFHRWLAATPDGVLPWEGGEPLVLEEQRYLVVVAAVCDGWCATFDTESNRLVPWRFRGGCIAGEG
jgi:predicted phosphodiesterase